jgi:hypothetical protein
LDDYDLSNRAIEFIKKHINAVELFFGNEVNLTNLSTDQDLIQEFIEKVLVEDKFTEPQRAFALSKYLSEPVTNIEEMPHSSYEFSTNNAEYLVLTDDEATILMVDTNINQRRKMLLSEKAFAYKMKLDAINHQGRTLSQVATKSDSAKEIGEEYGESRDQVFRYVRLNNLIPELLDKVDTKEIALKGELAGITITIRAIDADEWQEARAKAIKINAKGEPTVDNMALSSSLMAIGCVNPNFRDPAVLGGVTVPTEFVKAKFKPGEIEFIANKIMQHSGYGEEAVDTAKK